MKTTHHFLVHNVIPHLTCENLQERSDEENNVLVQLTCTLFLFFFGSSVLGEGEEHVTRRDQDPPRASWALLKPAAGEHTSQLGDDATANAGHRLLIGTGGGGGGWVGWLAAVLDVS